MSTRYVLIRQGTLDAPVWSKSKPMGVMQATKACDTLVEAGWHAIVETCEIVDAIGLPTEWGGWAS